MSTVRNCRRICCVLIFTTILLVVDAAAQENARPKYGPLATRLYQARRHIQRQPAPDYWALSPYYVAQPNNTSCSAAALTTVVNALRADENLTADRPLATMERIVALVDQKDWRQKIADDGPGVTLDELAAIARTVLDAYGMRDVHVKVVRLPDDKAAAAARLRELLVANERSQSDFLIANFLQSELTGDPDGAVGHIAPIAAYDATAARVLILDPDRQWYEPYWADEAALLRALMTKDAASGRPRGLLRVWRPSD